MNTYVNANEISYYDQSLLYDNALKEIQNIDRRDEDYKDKYNVFLNKYSQWNALSSIIWLSKSDLVSLAHNELETILINKINISQWLRNEYAIRDRQLHALSRFIKNDKRGNFPSLRIENREKFSSFSEDISEKFQNEYCDMRNFVTHSFYRSKIYSILQCINSPRAADEINITTNETIKYSVVSPSKISIEKLHKVWLAEDFSSTQLWLENLDPTKILSVSETIEAIKSDYYIPCAVQEISVSEYINLNKGRIDEVWYTWFY